MRRTFQFLFVVAALLTALPGQAETPADIAQQARTLRRNGHADRARALLAPHITAASPSEEIVEELIFSESENLTGEELKVKTAELEKRFPGPRAAHFVIRAQLLQETDPRAALAEVDKGLVAFPGSVSLISFKGALLIEKNPAEAATWFEENLKGRPDSGILHYGLGRASKAMGPAEPNLTRAMTEYQKAVELCPEWTSPLIEISSLQVFAGKPAEAYETIVRAEKADPDSLWVKEQKLRVLSRMPSPPVTPEEVWKEIQTILDKDGRALEPLAAALVVARRTGNEERSRALVDEILNTYPDTRRAREERIVRALDTAGSLKEEGKPAEAETILREALSHADTAALKSRVYDALLRLLIDDKVKVAVLLEQYAALVGRGELAPMQEIGIASRLMQAYGRIEDHEKAIAWALRTRELLGGETAAAALSTEDRHWFDLMISYTLGTAYFESGKYAEAKPILLALATEDAQDPGLQEMLGRIAVQEKDWEAAERHLGMAYRHSFFSAESEEQLKKMYEAKNGSEQGWDAYRDSLKKTYSELLRKETLESHTVAARPLADFQLTKHGSAESISTKSLTGKVTVLNLWATWCGPCRMEMPELEKLHKKHASSQTVAVYAVNAAETDALVRRYMKDKPYTFPILMDPDAWKNFGVNSIPHTFVIDPKGQIRYEVNGFNPRTDYVQMMDWLIEEAAQTDAP